jgi:hypothetical protein
METGTKEDTGKHSQTKQTVHCHVLVENWQWFGKEPEIYDGSVGVEIATVDGICRDVLSLLWFQFVK